jgi:hypothetical protein
MKTVTGLRIELQQAHKVTHADVGVTRKSYIKDRKQKRMTERAGSEGTKAGRNSSAEKNRSRHPGRWHA